MKYSPAEILRQHLIDEGSIHDPEETTSAGSQWPGYVASLPEEAGVPDDAVAVYDTTPVLEGRLMSGVQISHPGIQIRVRSLDYNAAFQKVQAICDHLATVSKQMVEMGAGELDEDFLSLEAVTRTSGPISIGRDSTSQKRYFNFTANFTLTIAPYVRPYGGQLVATLIGADEVDSLYWYCDDSTAIWPLLGDVYQFSIVPERGTLLDTIEEVLIDNTTENPTAWQWDWDPVNEVELANTWCSNSTGVELVSVRGVSGKIYTVEVNWSVTRPDSRLVRSDYFNSGSLGEHLSQTYRDWLLATPGLAADALVGLAPYTPGPFLPEVSLFSTKENGTGSAVRNRAHWLRAVDLTGISCFSDAWGTQYPFLLITARHATCAKHLGTPSGRVFFCGDNSGSDDPQYRTIASVYSVAGADLNIVTFDSDFPATVKPLQLLPANWWKKYLPHLDKTFHQGTYPARYNMQDADPTAYLIPWVSQDQYIAIGFASYTNPTAGPIPIFSWFADAHYDQSDPPVAQEPNYCRYADTFAAWPYQLDPRAGDSGSPALMIVGGHACVICHATTYNAGRLWSVQDKLDILAARVALEGKTITFATMAPYHDYSNDALSPAPWYTGPYN